MAKKRSARPKAVDMDIVRIIGDAVDDALKRRGKVNVMIAGKTGVGKSTLINAIFQGNMAVTGQGRPVTSHIREITKEGIPVSLFDTRGLELADYKALADEVENFLVARSQEEDPMRHIHVVWVCLAEDSRRVEVAESELVQRLSKHVPVVCVITKARADNGFRAEVQNLMPMARNVVSVLAIAEILDDGHSLPAKGLIELVELTMELVPEGHRSAFAAAQRVSLSKKRDRAHLIVGASATAAFGIGATPIPFSDAIALVPIQVGMLAGITAAFGIPLSNTFLQTLISSAITGVGATLLGRAIVSGILKMIPGAGSLIGGAIAGTTAAALTTLFGEAYVATLCLLMEQNPDGNFSTDEIARVFKEQLKRKKLKE